MRLTSHLAQHHALAALALLAIIATPALAQTPVGSGGYATVLPPGGSVPSNDLGIAVSPVVTANVTGAIPTTDWWTSIPFKFWSNNSYSATLAAQPLNLKARASGLGIGTSTLNATQTYYYGYHYQEDFLVQLDGMNAPETALDGYGDWTVTAHWEDGADQLQVTMGHGLPFVYFTKTSGLMELYFATGVPSVWYDQNGTLGFTVNGKHYAVFATDTGANYVYYNADDVARTITFSDGRTVTAGPGEYGVYEWVDGVSATGHTPNAPILLGAYPNPFNPRTTLAFELPHEMAVSLSVYDVAGRQVAELLRDEVGRVGRNEIVWNGTDDGGRTVSAGVYFYRLDAGGKVQTRRMTLIK